VGFKTEMKQKEFSVASIQFDIAGKNGNKIHQSFNVIHNLPEVFGLSLNDAIQNWSVRTDNFSVQSLCSYINSKKSGHICIEATAENLAKYKNKLNPYKINS
jgi:hypothetical protein